MCKYPARYSHPASRDYLPTPEPVTTFFLGAVASQAIYLGNACIWPSSACGGLTKGCLVKMGGMGNQGPTHFHLLSSRCGQYLVQRDARYPCVYRRVVAIREGRPDGQKRGGIPLAGPISTSPRCPRQFATPTAAIADEGSPQTRPERLPHRYSDPRPANQRLLGRWCR